MTETKGIESWSDSDEGSLEAADAKGSNTGRWTKEEHETFLLGLSLYGRDWKKVATAIKTRTPSQIRSHAQKYFQKLSRSPIQTDGQTHALGEEDKDAFTVLEYLESTLKSLKRRRDELDCSASLKGSLASLSSVRESESSYVREPHIGLSAMNHTSDDEQRKIESDQSSMEDDGKKYACDGNNENIEDSENSVELTNSYCTELNGSIESKQINDDDTKILSSSNNKDVTNEGESSRSITQLLTDECSQNINTHIIDVVKEDIVSCDDNYSNECISSVELPIKNDGSPPNTSYAISTHIEKTVCDDNEETSIKSSDNHSNEKT